MSAFEFQDYYEQIAAPFAWKFTKADLDALPERIAVHSPAARKPQAA